MNNKLCNLRLLRALKRTPKSQRFDRNLHCAIEKISNGKKMKSNEFNEVYNALYKVGPSVKYYSPEKWERVTRDIPARNLITQ